MKLFCARNDKRSDNTMLVVTCIYNSITCIMTIPIFYCSLDRNNIGARGEKALKDALRVRRDNRLPELTVYVYWILVFVIDYMININNIIVILQCVMYINI